MTALVRSELLKQRSTRTTLGLFAALLGLVLLAVLLHSFGLAVERLVELDVQLMILGRGEFLGVLFAALLGSLSFTTEVRYGTIRPTFLFSPRRARVVAAKASVAFVAGAGFGVLAGAVAIAAGTAAFRARGIDLQLDGGDFVLLVAGGATAAAMWSTIGLGIGVLVRRQVPSVVGICTWLLFVEGLLAGDIGALGDVGRFLPGSAAAAASGQGPGTLLSPGIGVVLLAAYAAAAALAGSFAVSRLDVE
ncbi:MAG TPA: ABC transporter permease [Actinomycetota bacterium]